MSRDEAIAIATEFVRSDGAVIVESFEGRSNPGDAFVVRLDGAVRLEGQWAVRFARFDPPNIVNTPNGVVVDVDESSGVATYFSLL